MNYKFIIVGPSEVGKTTWMNKLVNDIYIEEYIRSTTIESYQINYKNNLLTCIDIPATVTDDIIDNDQFKDIDGVFLMCDSSGDNISDIERWYSKLSTKNIKSVLIINKLDIDGDFLPESFCKTNCINEFIAISVQLDFQIFDPFEKMITLLNKIDIKSIKNLDVNIHLFVRKLMKMTKDCNNDMYYFKIGYIKLCHKEIFLFDNIVLKLINNINNLLLSATNIKDVLNFLITYKY